ncbi:MAG: hypothetical protein J1E64_06535 [Acetatifactor sp.]|nr:hypothetical protein [Acetatifactor sp.]
MDTMTGMTGSGTPLPLTGMPFGVSAALTNNDAAMNGFENLTETEKEHLILRCKDARSKEEVEKIVNSVAPDGGIEALVEEASAVYGPLENTGISGTF